MKLPGLAIFSVLALGSSFAAADPEVGTVHTMPVVTVYGRPPRPSVVIELVRPTAAREAGAAHEDLRVRLVAASAPAALQAR